MLKKRIIPKLLIKKRRFGDNARFVLVTTRGYADSIDVGDVVSQAKIYEAQLADELVVLSIDGEAISENEGLLKVIERLASETFMPLAVGGGVRNVDDFSLLLEHGADKVCVNTAAIRSTTIVSEAAARFGAQCVVVSIDIRSDKERGRATVFADHARVNTGRDPVEWACEVVAAGAGEILLTDADRDGSGMGLNIEVGRSIAAAVTVPVILSGGCGLARHFVEGFQGGRADGVAAGTFFCFRDQNPMQARAHVRSSGVPIRLETVD